MLLELALLSGAVLVLRKKPAPAPARSSQEVPSTTGNPAPQPGGSILDTPGVKEGAAAGGAALGVLAIPIVVFGAALGSGIFGVVDAFNAAAARDELWKARGASKNKLVWDVGNAVRWAQFMAEYDAGNHGLLVFNRFEHSMQGGQHGKFLPISLPLDGGAGSWFLFADGYVRRFNYNQTVKLPDGSEALAVLEELPITQEVFDKFNLGAFGPEQEVLKLTPLPPPEPEWVPGMPYGTPPPPAATAPQTQQDLMIQLAAGQVVQSIEPPPPVTSPVVTPPPPPPPTLQQAMIALAGGAVTVEPPPPAPTPIAVAPSSPATTTTALSTGGYTPPKSYSF